MRVSPSSICPRKKWLAVADRTGTRSLRSATGKTRELPTSRRCCGWTRPLGGSPSQWWPATVGGQLTGPRPHLRRYLFHDCVSRSWARPGSGLVEWFGVDDAGAGDVVGAQDRGGIVRCQRLFDRGERPPCVG